MHNPLPSNLSIYLCSLLVQEMSIGFKYNKFFINKEQAALVKGKPDVYLGLLCFLLLSIVCRRWEHATGMKRPAGPCLPLSIFTLFI